MRKTLAPILATVLCLCANSLPAQTAQAAAELSTAKLLLAIPGDPRPVNAMPTASAVSPDRKTVAFVHTGYGYEKNGGMQSITLLDTRSGELTEYNETLLRRRAQQSFSFGIAWSADGKRLYVSLGSISRPADNAIAIYKVKRRQLALEKLVRIAAVMLAPGSRAFPLNKHLPDSRQVSFPAGIARFEQRGREKLLVAENLSDTAAVVDAKSGRLEARICLGETKRVPSAYPYGAAVDARTHRGYISLWNSSEVVEIDLDAAQVTRSFVLLKPDKAIDAGSHPTALLLSNDSRTLYAALSNRDQIAAVDLNTGKTNYASTAAEGQYFAGSYPNALALSEDGKTLFAANAAANDVAVLAVHGGEVQAGGFVPTEWYPTALAFVRGQLFVGSGKGNGTGPNGARDRKSRRYIATLLHGSIATIPAALIARDLPQFTAQALASNRYREAQHAMRFAAGANPIRHVIYILKENRTYDQIFGDIAEANGDPGLVMFGEDVTPNQHALARQFGVLDNFYDSGEVSGNGHVWSTAAISSDYTEKIWPLDYRGERTYDFEGTVANAVPWREGIADVNEPGTGYLWTDLAGHGKSFRHYGEYVMSVWCGEGPEATLPEEGTPVEATQACRRNVVRQGEPLALPGGGDSATLSPYPWPVPVLAADVGTKPELAGHFDPYAADFKLDYPDQLRADEFLREFRGFVAARESGAGGQLPDFVLLRLPDDHTSGTKPGKPSPPAAVADNDLAVGRVVEAVSHSRYWDDTAIFVIEDDAQDGADHVDAHRSTALVISKYAPRAQGGRLFVESGFFTTVNLIHTMEALLDIPPMNANDAYAPLMARLLSGDGTQAAFTANYRNRDNRMIYEVNASDAPGARQSAKLDFSHADAADTSVLNRVLWQSRMGKRQMPKPVHAVIPVSRQGDGDD